MVWSPLASGFLSGKYTRQDPTGGKGRIADFDFLPIDRERGYDLIEKMRGIAQRHNSSPAQVALAWLLAKPFVSSILLGASKVSQLEDNLAAANVQLTANELAELATLTAPVAIYPNWFQAKTHDPAASAALGKKNATT